MRSGFPTLIVDVEPDWGAPVRAPDARLRGIREGHAVSGLAGFTLEAAETFLASLVFAARTVNSHRQTYHAFAEWRVRPDRPLKNPVAYAEKRNEAVDRRRVRRPFTGEELRRLPAVAQKALRHARIETTRTRSRLRSTRGRGS